MRPTPPALRFALTGPIAGLALALWGPSLLDGQSIARTLRTEYYDVQGETPEELRRAMQRLGPVHDGERVYGFTRWTLRWRYSYQPHETWGCTVTHVELELETVITLPRWTPPPGADPELVRAWDRFVTALGEHEEGHRLIAEAAAREARRRLRRVRAPVCSLMERKVQEEGDRVIADHERQGEEYDQETGRGRTQGAVWPPSTSRRRPSGTSPRGPAPW